MNKNAYLKKFLFFILSFNQISYSKETRFFTYERLFNKSRLHNYDDFFCCDKKKLDLTFILTPYTTNNKVPTIVIGSSSQDSVIVKVELFQQVNNEFVRIVKEAVTVCNNLWTFKLPPQLPDGNYFVRASLKKNYVYFMFKINKNVPTLAIDFNEIFQTKTNNLTISGAASPGSTINAKVNDIGAVSLPTNYSGNWVINLINKFKPGYNKILISAYNSLNNPKNEPAVYAFIINYKV